MMSEHSDPPEAKLVNSQHIPSENVLPVHTENQNHDLTQIQEIVDNTLKVEIYNRARVVRILSIIDMVFLTINLLISLITSDYFFVFFLFFPMCLCGYYGAKNYNKYLTMGYSSYLFIMTIIYLSITIVYSNFIYLILLIIQCYFLIYTLNLIRSFRLAQNYILESLRDGWKPDDGLIVVYYY